MRAAEALERRAWRGHFFVTSGRIGTPGFLAPEELRELVARGHVVGSHSDTHPTYMGRLSVEALQEEWTRSRAVIAELLGAEPRTASVPGGYLSPTVIAGAAAAGYEVLFTSEPTARAGRLPRAGLVVRGRYTIWATTPARVAAAYARGQRLRVRASVARVECQEAREAYEAAVYQRLRGVRARRRSASPSAPV